MRRLRPRPVERGARSTASAPMHRRCHRECRGDGCRQPDAGHGHLRRAAAPVVVHPQFTGLVQSYGSISITGVAAIAAKYLGVPYVLAARARRGSTARDSSSTCTRRSGSTCRTRRWSRATWARASRSRMPGPATSSSSTAAAHVGIYIGAGHMIDAPYPGSGGQHRHDLHQRLLDRALLASAARSRFGITRSSSSEPKARVSRCPRRSARVSDSPDHRVASRRPAYRDRPTDFVGVSIRPSGYSIDR